MQSWVTSSLVRHFPSTPAQTAEPLTLDAALNEQVSFQVAMRQEDQGLRVRVAVDARQAGSRVRRVGYVLVRHLNTPVEADRTDVEGWARFGYVPVRCSMKIRSFCPPRTHAFWVTVRPGAGAEPGLHSVRVTLLPEG